MLMGRAGWLAWRCKLSGKWLTVSDAGKKFGDFGCTNSDAPASGTRLLALAIYRFFEERSAERGHYCIKHLMWTKVSIARCELRKMRRTANQNGAVERTAGSTEGNEGNEERKRGPHSGARRALLG